MEYKKQFEMNSKKIKNAKMNVNLGIAIICFASLLIILALGSFSIIGILGYFGIISGFIYTKKAKKYLKELEEE